MKVTHERSWARGSGRLLFIGCFIWPILMGGTGANGATSSALQVSPHSHDFGAVHRLGGHVHTSFVVHNQGDTPIKIRRIWTS
jgi:hypothetical protein